MTHENEDQKPIDETTEDEIRPIDQREIQLVRYAQFMRTCYQAADDIITCENLVSSPGTLNDIAIALFNRCTREMPEQAKVLTLALKYLGKITKKTEDQKDLFVPLLPSIPPINTCKHPQLQAFREIMLYQYGRSLSLTGNNIIDALGVKHTHFEHREPMLCCPACRAFVSVAKFKDGTFFSKPEEDEQKK